MYNLIGFCTVFLLHQLMTYMSLWVAYGTVVHVNDHKTWFILISPNFWNLSLKLITILEKKRAKQCELAHTCFSASSSLCNKRFTYHSLKNFFRELYSFDRKVFSSVIFSSEIIWLSLNAWWSFFLWWIPDTLQNSLHQFESNLLNDSTYPYMTYHYQTLAAISCIVANLLL